MSNLIKLNELTSELEKSLAENRAIQSYLKEIKTVVEALSETSNEFRDIEEKFDIMQQSILLSSQKIEATLKSLGDASDKNWAKLIKENSVEITNFKINIVDTLNNFIPEIRKSTEQFHQATGKQISIIHADLKKFETEVLGNINKFKNDLDANLKTRLDKHASDIQLAIRNEGGQIQRSMELAIKESSIKSDELISKKISNLKIVILIAIICSSIAVLAGTYFIKLFLN
jgi:hypothetical protein